MNPALALAQAQFFGRYSHLSALQPVNPDPYVFGGRFPLGPTWIATGNGIGDQGGTAPLLSRAVVLAKLGTDHALGLGGAFGTASSAATPGIPGLNFASMAASSGPVRSRYVFGPTDPGVTIPGSTTGKVVVLEILTYLIPGQPGATVAYADVIQGGV